MNTQSQSGFTLIELIVVTVIVGMASVPILGRFTQVAGSALINEEIQTASQLAQERAESLLALRRRQGYAAVLIGTQNDVLSGVFTEYVRTVDIVEPSAIGGCVTGTACKSVTVTVSRRQVERAVVSYVLLDY